jgi:predicted nucleic acid-binding protein
MVHLDTNFLILSLVPGTQQDQLLRGWLSGGESINVSTIAWAEFLCGPLDAIARQTAMAMFPNPEAFGATDAARAAELFNQTGRRRGTLIDCMIAATCIERNVPLATENVVDFRRFEQFGLRLIGP